MFIDPLNSSLAFLPVKFSRNKIEHVIDPADTTLADRSRLRYFLELLVPSFPGAADFERLVKMPGSEKPPQTAGGSSVYEGCFYQLSELLDGFLEYQKPAPGAAELCIISTLTMPYLAKETVVNNGVLLPASTKDKPNQYVLKAGLSEPDFAAWGETFFTSYMSEHRPFLTWQPDGKQVSLHQEEYLYFLLNCSPVPATLIRRVRITFQDGTVDVQDAGQLTGGQAMQVVCVPVGPMVLGISGSAIKYEVWLAEGPDRNRVSQVRTYWLDRRNRSQERFILFANSLGGWDTLRLLGEGSQTLATVRTTATLERPAGAPADFSELRVVHLEGSRSLTVSTGWLEQRATEQLKYLDELLLAKEVYLVDNRGHQALELLTSSLIDQEDNTDLLARSFSFRIVAAENNYSSLPAAPAAPARATGWRGVGVVQVLDGNGKRTGKGRPLKLQKYYTDNGSTFKPLTEKPNQPGDPDYQSSLPMPGVEAGSTPFASREIQRPTTFTRTTCQNGQLGEAAMVVVPAGKYGSETSQADADSKADAEYWQLNTQAYANKFGACTAAPELYQVTVPAGCWHFRAANGQQVETYWYQYGSGELTIGDTWDLQGQSRPFVYPRFSADMDLPVKASYQDYRLLLYGNPNTQVNLKIWKNGVLQYDQNTLLNQDSYEQISLPVQPVAGDRFYLKVTQR